MRTALLLLLTACTLTAQIPRNCRQLIVGKAANWNSSYVTLTIYQKSGRSWQVVGTSWKGRLGRNGLAWGQGVHKNPTDSKASIKKEGDKRAPAGVFKIGGAYGYKSTISKHAALKYRKVGVYDLWVEDRTSANYNKHLVIKHVPKSTWEKKAQMRQNDHAHSLKLYIGHNDAILGGKPIPGLGSAIFFHIWRGGGSKSTAGCTTMHESQLKKLISQIDPNKNPVYVLLPNAEYQQLKASWKLP